VRPSTVPACKCAALPASFAVHHLRYSAPSCQARQVWCYSAARAWKWVFEWGIPVVLNMVAEYSAPRRCYAAEELEGALML